MCRKKNNNNNEADWFVRTGKLKHVNQGTLAISLSSVSCFSSNHLRKYNLSNQTALCFLMKFPSKEFPVITLHFFWYFSFERFPNTQKRTCFPQCHFIINYNSVVYPFGMKHFLKAPIKSNCLLCLAILGFP